MNRSPQRALASIMLALVTLLSACSLPKAGTFTPAPVPSEAASLTPTIAPLPAGLAVRISSPAAGAQLPGGSPLQVAFAASGGPFAEFDLLVDNVNVASQPAATTAAQVSGSLQWEAPTSGPHTLKVQVLDVNKNIASAEVQVQVGAGGTPVGSTPTSTTAPAGSTSSGGMTLRFVNLSDGGTVNATLDANGKPTVTVKVEVSGAVPAVVTLTANDMFVPGEARNPGGANPFTAELLWSPLDGGGDYTLVATATTNDKQFASASAHVTVTGIAKFTATPPPLDQAAAQKRFAQLYQQLYGVTIPAPSMERFDFPKMPNRSRWISAVYYRGQRYYIELFDDTHYELSPEVYADPAHPSNKDVFTVCRPAGEYKILVVFVDYGNVSVDKTDALFQALSMANWTNQLYDIFAASRGLTSSPLHIQVGAAWISQPPNPGNMLTRAQIQSASGADPAKYNFVMEIDLDKNNSVGKNVWHGVLDTGGGVAIQGCGALSKYEMNIWSGVADGRELEGGLVMDFNHELSHLFGMMDSWPFSLASIMGPDGATHDDWIPYVMFGWTDTDGDGIPEIIDPTPYGTNGPRP